MKDNETTAANDDKQKGFTGYRISDDGAQKFTSNRGQIKGLLIYNPGAAASFPELKQDFNLEDVKAWAWYSAPGYRHSFLIARVDGVCVVVIKKNLSKVALKALRNIRTTPWGGTEAKALHEKWREGDETAFPAMIKSQEAWKQEMQSPA